MNPSLTRLLESRMPRDQANAYLESGLVTRVGIPHRSGKLVFHAFNEGYPVMVSANAFWDPAARQFAFPSATDLTELDYALDSAGYSAISLWQKKGKQSGIAGVYPWSLEQYLSFAISTRASWYAQPDLCCEPEICSNDEEIDYRIDATATLLEGCLRIAYEYQNQLVQQGWSESAVRNEVRLPVPVLQGWRISHYARSLELMRAVWERWQPWAAPPALIGLGSVCRRSLRHPDHGLFAILASLEGELPQTSRLHLFGVKGTAIDQLKMFDWIASTDSMSFDLGARRKAFEAGISNTIDHRKREMSKWMETARRRAMPTAGDQFRLNLH